MSEREYYEKQHETLLSQLCANIADLASVKFLVGSYLESLFDAKNSDNPTSIEYAEERCAASVLRLQAFVVRYDSETLAQQTTRYTLQKAVDDALFAQRKAEEARVSELEQATLRLAELPPYRTPSQDMREMSDDEMSDALKTMSAEDKKRERDATNYIMYGPG